MAAAGGSSLSAPGHRTAGRYPRTNRPGAARAVARKSRSRELAHYMVHHDLPNSPSPPPTAVSSGCSGGRTRPGWRWSRPGAGTTITRRLDETHRSGPARSQLHCVRGVVECSGFCERVVGAEAICLSRGDVLRLSLTTGRSSSLLGRPSPLVLLDAHRPGAACADGPGWGIAYARFRFFGWPSRGRWQRGRTVRQNAGQCPLSRRQALAYGNSQASVTVVPPKAVTANAFRTRLARSSVPAFAWLNRVGTLP
jgi:hypothetical protein